MEKTCKNLAASIGEKLGYDQEKQAVIAYGLTAILQMLTILFFLTVLGLLLGCWYECLVIVFSAGFLKRYTGGNHLSTLLGCIIFSVTVVSLLSLFIKYILLNLFLTWEQVSLAALLVAMYAIVFMVIYKLAPAAAKNRPITKESKRLRLRRGSFIVAAVFFAISVGLLFLDQSLLSISFSFAFAALWQVFTMTFAAGRLLELLEAKQSDKVS